MAWFYTLSLSVTFVLLAFYFFNKNRRKNIKTQDPDLLTTEMGDEIGVPPEAAMPTERARAPASRRFLPGSRLRKDNLSKEVELDWEASDMIRIQPGAWARTKDAAPDRPHEEYGLPPKYGGHRLVLLARDPDWIYAYWDIAHEKYQEMYKRHLQEWGLSRPALRFYDLTPGQQAQMLDVHLEDGANNWYVNIGRPSRRLVAELGRLFPAGFEPLLRSNEIVTPARGVSKIISQDWRPLDWESYYGKYDEKDAESSPWVWGKQQN